MEQPPRRSHASLRHLTLSPLTLSYPLLPTSPSPPLHTSTSYSYLASPTYPSKPTILSRSSSRTSLRSNHAGPQPINTSKSSPSFTKKPPRPAHHKRASANAIPTSAFLSTSTLTSPTRRADDEESSWLLRTASTLQTQRMEEKGQAWLATRNSSTSLTKIDVDGLSDDESSPFASAYSRPRSPEWPETPSFARSRVQSRHASRIQSRAGSGARLRDDVLRALTKGGQDATQDKVGDGGEIMGPDFIDPAVFEDEEVIEGEEIDESEMKRIIMGRARGWVDWAVGWMDLRNEEEEGEGSGDDIDEEIQANATHAGNIDGEGQREPKSSRNNEGVEYLEEAGIFGPPPRDEGAGVLADARWLLNVASKLIV